MSVLIFADDKCEKLLKNVLVVSKTQESGDQINSTIIS